MSQIKNDISEQKISRHASMKVRRQEASAAEVKLILVPCLCDLNEMRAWTLRADAKRCREDAP